MRLTMPMAEQIVKQQRVGTLLQANEVCTVPSTVAACPVCGGPIKTSCSAWCGHTGRPLREGITIWCEHDHELGHGRESNRRCGPEAWQQVFDAVARWAGALQRASQLTAGN